MTAGPRPARCAAALIRGHTATTVQTGKNAYGWKEMKRDLMKTHVLIYVRVFKQYSPGGV